MKLLCGMDRRVRKTIGELQGRFTPRRATSNWSAVNIGRAQELSKQGRWGGTEGV
jgi:hypothetical protein